MDRTRLTRMFIPALMCMAAATPCAATASAETADDRYILYINTYSQMAVDQQAQFGIPASITLAQGLLESAAGRSTLAREGNNHFGIKCHKGWEGKSMLRDDDAPGECFRVYGSAAESYRDHSLFLSRERYRPLFSHDVTDYASWARGLSRCGYATDPNYASRLIAIIERYALYLYDTPEGREADEDAAFIQASLISTHPVRRARGLHYVIAAPGDTYTSIAREFKLDAKKLREFNDAGRHDKIKDWEEVYLESKLDDAPKHIDKAVIGERESMHSIAQRYGMKLSRLKALNPGVRDKAGATLRLR